MRGSRGRLGLQRWPDGLGSFGHASLPSALAPNRGWLLSCRLSLATPLDPHIAFRRAPPYVDFSGSSFDFFEAGLSSASSKVGASWKVPLSFRGARGRAGPVGFILSPDRACAGRFGSGPKSTSGLLALRLHLNRAHVAQNTTRDCARSHCTLRGRP
jgi:hypothetical protein